MSKAKGQRPEETALGQALQLVSPGTRLREAISTILQSGNGALICLGDPKRLAELSEGGVEVNCACTRQLLFELSKMDGAILMDSKADRILYANRFLKPDNSIPSAETGTRHRAAERMSVDAQCTVIAVSQRRGSVTLYVNGRRHLIDSIATLMNKAGQALQALEKYINVLNQSMLELTTREFQDMVTIFDVCRAVQRFEIVNRIAKEIEPYLLGLGTEGRLIELQLKELLPPIEEARLVVKDYCKGRGAKAFKTALEKLSALSQAELLELSNISQALGYGPNLSSVDTYLAPRGFRVLTQTHRLPPQIIENLVQRFETLQAIIRASKEDLQQVDGVGEVLAERTRVSLNLLRNQLTLEKGF